MKEEQLHKAGMCWFAKEDWDKLKQAAEDTDSLEDTWEQWHQRSLDMIEAFAQRDIIIEKVEVNVDDLIAWCESKGKKVNTSTRAEFVTEKMMQAKKAN